MNEKPQGKIWREAEGEGERERKMVNEGKTLGSIHKAMAFENVGSFIEWFLRQTKLV